MFSTNEAMMAGLDDYPAEEPNKVVHTSVEDAKSWSQSEPTRPIATPDEMAINYDAPPTVSQFMMNDLFLRFILGPIGSGKTTGVMFELLRRATQQAPGPDGIRRTRWAIVRNTLSQIKQTVLRDIESWLRPIVRLRVADNIIIIETGDVYCEIFMIPLDDPEDKRRLLSMQLTGIWINEFIEVDPALVPDMAGRCGRYPGPREGGATWAGIIGDSNMPNVGSEWHRLLEVERPEDWGVFVQPSGMADNAENLPYLTQTPDTLLLPVDSPVRIEQGRKYYRRLLGQHSRAWVKRYILARYGDDPDGTAVFRDTFSRDSHVAPGRVVRITVRDHAPDNEFAFLDEDIHLPPEPVVEGGLTPIPGFPIVVGQDFGRNPCAVFTQVDHRGRFLVLDEIVSVGMGLETHLTYRLRPKLMSERYREFQVIVVGDPSGVAKSQLSEESCFDLLQRLGFAAVEAPTNKIDPRIRAVERLLLQGAGNNAYFKMDEARCPKLLKAMMGLYRFGKTRTGEVHPLPEKTNPWSDLADALQYAALAAEPGYRGVVSRQVAQAFRGRAHTERRPPPPARGWT